MVFLLTLSSAFSALADIGGDETNMQEMSHAFESPVLYNVASDLADYEKLPSLYIGGGGLPYYTIGNTISHCKSNQIEYMASPFLVNGYVRYVEFIYEIYDSSGIDRSLIKMSSTGKVSNVSFFMPYSDTAVSTVDGINYVDDNTVRFSICYDYTDMDAYYSNPFKELVGMRLSSSCIDSDDTISLSVYAKIDYGEPPKVTVSDNGGTGGGDGGGGSGSGGAAT